MQSIEFNLKRFAPMIVLALMFAVQTSTQQHCVGQDHQEQIEDQYAEKRAERDRLSASAKEAQSTGNLAETTKLIEQMLEIERNWLGKNNPELISSLDWLAEVYQQQGAWEKATKSLESAVSLSRNIHGEAHWRTVDFSLAVRDLKLISTFTPIQQKELKQADELELQRESERQSGNNSSALKAAFALAKIHQGLFGEEHSLHATALHEVAVLHRLTGDYAAAEEVFFRSRDIRERVLGKEHPSYADSLNSIAFLYQQVGNPESAKALYLQCSEIQKKTLGEEHPDYANTLNNLADSYRVMGDYAKSEPLLRRVKDIRKMALGEGHEAHCSSLTRLASIYQLMRDYERSESLFLECRDIHRRVRGETHTFYGISLSNLAGLYQSMGDFSRAEPLFLQGLEIQSKAVGVQHPNYITNLGNLAGLYRAISDRLLDEGKSDLAILQLEKVLEIELKIFGASSEYVLSTQRSIAALEQELGRWERAIAIRRKISQTLDEALGESHWEAIDARLDAEESEQQLRLNDQQKKEVALAEEMLAKGNDADLAGDYEGAIKAFKEAGDIFKNNFGKKHRSYALAVSSAGLLQATEGDLLAAESSLLKLQELLEKSVGKSHPSYAESLFVLALLYSESKPAKAESLLIKSGDVYRESLGEGPDFALTLYELAKLRDASGKQKLAQPLYKQSLDIQRKTIGELNLDFIATLSGLANSYESVNDFKQAKPLYIQCRDITKEVFGNEHPEYAMSLDNLGRLYLFLGRFSQAKPLFRECLDIRKKALGEEHPEYATSLNNLAALHTQMGDYSLVEPLYIKCRDIQKRVFGDEHPNYANALSNLAGLYTLMGDYVRAESLYFKCRDILKGAHGVEHPDYAMALSGLGGLYELMGDYPQSELNYTQCLEIQKKALGEQHLEYATTLANLAGLYDSMGDYARAVPLCLRSRDIHRTVLGEDHPSYGTILNHLGGLQIAMGDYSQAELQLKRSLDIYKETLGEQHPNYGKTLANLALLYGLTDDVAQAEPLQQRCVELCRSAFGENHPDFATTLDNQAGLFDGMGEYERAEKLYLRARDIRKQIFGEKHPAYATSLNNLAGLYESTGDFEQANSLYFKCRDILKQINGDQDPIYAAATDNHAGLYVLMSDWKNAESLAAESLKISFNLLADSSIALSERQQLAMNQQLRHRLDGYLSLAIQEGASFRSKAARQVLNWKGQTLVRQRNIRLVGKTPALNERFTQLQSVSRKLASLSRTSPDFNTDTWMNRVEELTRSKEELEAELSSKSIAFQDATKTVTPDAIQASIPNDAVLIDFLQFQYSKPSKLKKGEIEWMPSVLAVVVKRNSEPQLFDLGQMDSLAEEIDDWRKTYGTSTQGKQAAIAIRKQIWEPLLESIGDSKTVLVSTDGVLGRMPIGALPGKEEGTYLIEDHRIAMIPVPRLLPELVKKKTESEIQGELLLLGDVDYNSNSKRNQREETEKSVSKDSLASRMRQEFSALPGAANEVAAIETLYGRLAGKSLANVKALKQTDASEAEFRKLAGNYRVLHLATHGFFAPPEIQSAMGTESLKRSSRARLASPDSVVTGMNPDLLSGLAFAGANLDPVPGEDDGILTAQEIAFLPLDGVETAVLSACQTGLGEVAGGEGLIGIQRAFQIAGVRTTVASLWKVDDPATRKLMELFYTNLIQKKMSRLDALREAQLHILNHPESIHSSSVDSNREKRSPSLDVGGSEETDGRASPELWAAFQLSGDWR